MANDETIKLMALVGVYTSSDKENKNPGTMRPKDKTPEAARELDRFVKHFRELEIDLPAISPSQIGSYAEDACKNSSAPEALEGLQAVRKFLKFAYDQEATQVNLSTHFRIRRPRTSLDSKGDEGLNRGQQMTQEGYNQLITEKSGLESNRVSISEAIHRAASDGDVRENAPLEAAREQQGREEARIKEIDSMLRTAIIVDGSGKGTKSVRVGTTIRVEEVSKKKKTKYTLVSPSEANPLEGKISDASPLGKAFIGKRAGQLAVADTPKGNTTFKIIDIS